MIMPNLNPPYRALYVYAVGGEIACPELDKYASHSRLIMVVIDPCLSRLLTATFRAN